MAEQPARSRVFDRHDGDCGGGKLTVEDACRGKGLDPAEVLLRTLE